MKIDVSILQAGALAGAVGLGALAACNGEWGIVSAVATGLFALLGIRRHEQEPPQ